MTTLSVAPKLSDARGDVVDVAVDDLLVAKRALAARELAGDGKLVDVLDVRAVDGAGVESQLEPVVLGGIV